MKRLVALLLTLTLCCTAFAALAEDVTLKVWDGQDDQELLKELCEAYAAAHPENSYNFQYGVVGTADASARYLEDPAAAADVFVYPDDQLIRFTLCEEALSMQEHPEILLCTNNYIAMACLQVLRQKDLSVPQDIAIMTFDNYPFSMLTQPQLTAVEADMFDMGQEAARFILRKIRMPELQTQSYCTIPRVIERKST